MSMKRYHRWTILELTFLLTLGVVVMVAAAFSVLVLVMRPPFSAPVTVYEIARVLDGKEIATEQSGIRIRYSNEAPAEISNSADALLIRDTLAGHISKRPDQIVFSAENLGLRGPGRETFSPNEPPQSLIQREHRLYSADSQFNPHIFTSFTAGVREADGRWRVIYRDNGRPFDRWQFAMLRWIVLAVFLAAPIAWLFSRRIAEPIRAFAGAAERLGRHQQMELVEVRGPAEIRSAAQALNDMQARLSRFVAERTSMVGAIAHDLRTPLARLAFQLDSAPDELRRKAEAEIDEMKLMISAVLDFVQHEGRTQKHEPLDLRLLVEGVVDDLTDLGRDVRMVEGLAVTVIGDPTLLRRLFSNLISNAVTYGKRAVVSMTAGDKSVVVEIADQGPGLAEEDLARAFEPFFRAESSRNRATGGIGLGLAIVRAAAQAHGGEVILSNMPAGGLCAKVTLPRMMANPS